MIELAKGVSVSRAILAAMISFRICLFVAVIAVGAKVLGWAIGAIASAVVLVFFSYYVEYAFGALVRKLGMVTYADGKASETK